MFFFTFVFLVVRICVKKEDTIRQKEKT